MSTTHINGYLALPPSGTGDPVLVLHAWWGLNTTFKAVCDRLAEAGFVAFAPDLHHGKIATTIAEAEALVDEPIFGSATGVEKVRAEVAAAVAWLRDHAEPSTSKLTVVGFSMGAFFALDASMNLPEAIGKVVIFYGSYPADADSFRRSQASYLGHFAENDAYEPGDAVERLEASLKAAGRSFTFHQYPGTGHWFFEPDVVQAYDLAAASLAWERTLAFLRR